MANGDGGERIGGRGGAQVIIKNYGVAGHFTIHLTISASRLADLSSP